MKPKGYNRNIMGSKKRPHKGISSMPIECINSLSKRVVWESKRLEMYLKRVGQLK